MEKEGFLQNSNFYLRISHSVLVKISWNNGSIVYLKFHDVQLFLSMQNYVTGKGCLMSFTLGFGFFDSQSKHFLISFKDNSRYMLLIENHTP